MAVRFNLPIIAFDDANGNPLSGGFVEFYVTETDTPKDIFADDDLTTPYDVNDDGQVVLDSAGRHDDLFLEEGDYKVIVKDSLGTIIKTMDPVHGTADGSDLTAQDDFPVYMEGKPDAGEIFPIYNITRSMTLPADLEGGVFTIETLPTAPLVVTLYKNGSSLGTISFATNGTPTVTFALDVSFTAGDQFIVAWPESQDSTGADVALTFVFTVD